MHALNLTIQSTNYVQYQHKQAEWSKWVHHIQIKTLNKIEPCHTFFQQINK